MTTDADATTFKGWVVVELMGHRRLGGYASEALIAGVPMLRIDIPGRDGEVTQYYGGKAIYSLSPVTEELARAVARSNQPELVHRWELPARVEDAELVTPENDDEDDPEDDDSEPDPAPTAPDPDAMHCVSSRACTCYGEFSRDHNPTRGCSVHGVP